jgi:RNA polymerase sigma factor (sigma-70 family)
MDDDLRARERSEDAALVARAVGDDPDAFGRLYDRWFDRAHDLAFRITRDDAAAADVAQDAFVAAWKNLAKLENPEAFGGWLLRITRNGALDRKRRDARATPVDGESMAVIESGGPSPASAPAGFRVEDRTRGAEDPAQAVEDGELVALVWESAEALGERDTEILDLGLRHGLTPAEVGDVVGLNRNAANQAVHRVRNRLKTAVEARVLWRSGEPVCAGLADALAAAGVTRFGADAVRVSTQHAEQCAECQERRQLRLEPSKMFVAIPILSPAWRSWSSSSGSACSPRTSRRRRPWRRGAARRRSRRRRRRPPPPRPRRSPRSPGR